MNCFLIRTPREKIRIAVLHMDRLIALKGESVAVREMRKHLAWYLKGLPDRARVKDAIMDETKRDRMVEIRFLRIMLNS